jgi:murein DD-endopeptidase MepM/ murein hydrolase activator NlpD
MRCLAKSPLNPLTTRVGSGYGDRPGRTSGATTFHAGLDFVGKIGDPVRSIMYGQIARIARNDVPSGFSGYGNAVVVYHPELGLYSFYAHLSRVNVVPGQMVAPGQIIGAVGNTTNGKFPGMGAHLHMEIRRPKPDGSMPFPGGYRVFNLDPAIVLDSVGVKITPSRYVKETCLIA